MTTAVVSMLAVMLAGYAAVLAALWWQQEKLLFQPRVLRADHAFGFGDDVHDDWVDVPSARLHALHLRLPAPRGVVFFLHGNAGSLAEWFVNADFYRSAGFDLYMLDYRGYGKSSGRIASQAQLEADVRAAWDRVAPQYAGSAGSAGSAGRRRVVLGRSLGSALAAGLAAEVQPELTVLVSPYASMSALAREVYPWVPPALLRYPLRTDAALARLHGRVLLLHGAQDALISPDHSRRLLLATRQAQLVLVDGAGHNDIQAFDEYRNAVADALARP